MPSPSSTKRTVFALLAALGCVGAGDAQTRAPAAAMPAFSPSCPAQLVTEQSSAEVPGWEAHRHGGANRLQGYGFYDGPVADNIELAPADESTRGRISVSRTSFAGIRGRVYFACRYAGTDIVLSKPLPAGVRQCTDTSNAMRPAAKDAAIGCR